MSTKSDISSPAYPSEADPRFGMSAWKIASVAMIGSFLSQLDTTIVTVSLSSLASSFHADLSTIQWVTSGYLLALALTLPLSGWLVDGFGARLVYLWCFSLFMVSSALCGLAWSAGSLIGFRVAQGLTGGLLAPMTQLMLVRAAGRRLPQMMSIAALPVLLAPILGPVLAGVILQHFSWRWLFLLNVPIGTIAILLAIVVLPSDREQLTRRRLDWQGLILLSPGLALFLYGMENIDFVWGAAAIIPSVVLLGFFIGLARHKGEKALIDLELFRTSSFSASVVTQFLINGAMFAGQMVLPIYLVRGCGISPAAAGLLLAPQGLGSMLTYICMGRLAQRFTVRQITVSGAMCAFVGTLALALLAEGNFASGPFIAALFLRGAGMSAIGVPSISSAYASIQRCKLPMASTALNIVQRLGGPTLTTLCAAFLSWRLNVATAIHEPGPFAATFALLCVLLALVLVAALRLPNARTGDLGTAHPTLAGE